MHSACVTQGRQKVLCFFHPTYVPSERGAVEGLSIARDFAPTRSEWNQFMNIIFNPP